MATVTLLDDGARVRIGLSTNDAALLLCVVSNLRCPDSNLLSTMFHSLHKLLAAHEVILNSSDDVARNLVQYDVEMSSYRELNDTFLYLEDVRDNAYELEMPLPAAASLTELLGQLKSECACANGWHQRAIAIHNQLLDVIDCYCDCSRGDFTGSYKFK